MIKKITALLLTAIIGGGCFAGCSQPEDIDASAIADALLTGGTYAETLSQVSAAITNKRYGLTGDMVEETVAYSGTNAVVDEIAVFKAKGDINAIITKAVEHIDAQTKTYESYRPDELPKLRDSILTPVGDCVVVCVSADAAKAREILDGFMKN